MDSKGRSKWTKTQEGCCCKNLTTKTVCLESGKHKFIATFASNINQLARSWRERDKENISPPEALQLYRKEIKIASGLIV